MAWMWITPGRKGSRTRERKKERKEGRKEGFARFIRGETWSKSRKGWKDKALERLTRYSSQTRTTAWKGWLDRDHSCRRLIRAIFHGKLSTDQRRKMKKVFFLTALTCANIPSIPSRLEATLEIILEKERREERPFRSSLSLCLIGENWIESFFDFILKFTATSL